MSKETPEDSMAAEETTGKASPSRSKNAFTALMNPKRKAPPSPSSSEPAKKQSNKNLFARDGLGDYIAHPEKYPTSSIIFHNASFVAINDLYPKASVHALLLPRSAKHTRQHPFDAFEDAEFLASVREQAGRLRGIVAAELQRKYGRFSPQDAAREAVLNGEVELAEGEPMPKGRDWAREVKVGVHAHPSMNHLHVHVVSREMYSECLKHRKHYNSFATGFFVDLEDFPLAQDDPRRWPEKEGYLEGEMRCWRCGKGFGNKFARLKEHLAVEFGEWKKE